MPRVLLPIDGPECAVRCDQTVMGTHGRGALDEGLLASVTLKIVHLSKIPVPLVN